MTAAEEILRPNGKLYRARKPPCVVTYNDRDDCECVAVLRTHDIPLALELAAVHIAALDLNPDKAAQDWWRLVPFDAFHMGYDQTWVTDTARGTPCVVIPYE